MDLPEPAQLPEVAEADYPPDAVTEAQRLRFRTALGVAQVLFGGWGEDQVWSAARVLYRSERLVD